MSHRPRPITQPFFTPGVIALLFLLGLGAVPLAYRFLFGFGAVTNLDDFYPWGLWIGIDVATGVALAAGGFTTSFIAQVLHRDRYQSIVRPALLTAMIGYTFVAIGVVTDVGRYYNIYRLFVPSSWQVNSALFVVGACESMYIVVLYIEFLPVVVERFMGKVDLPGRLARLNGPIEALLRFLDRTLNRVLFLFIILGIVLSCVHQSSLGTLLTIVETKVHPLWYSPWLPLLFLTSAFAVGYAMVVVESVWAHKSLGLPMHTGVLADLTRYTPWLMGIYIALRIYAITQQGGWARLADMDVHTFAFLLEFGVGVLVPFVLFAIPRTRRNPKTMFVASLLYVLLGVMGFRFNAFITAYHPPLVDYHYVPSLGEVLVTLFFISLHVLLYRAAVTIFPIIEQEEPVAPAGDAALATQGRSA